MNCDTHHKKFKQFYKLDDGIELAEYMCPDCRGILYKELGYSK